MQTLSIGLLKQSGSVDLCTQWTAGFHAALSAAYLSLRPSMHTTIKQALMDCLPISLLKGTLLPGTATADESEAVDLALLAQSQSQSDQLVLATSASEHSTSTVWHPGKGIKAAWSDSPKHNLVAPLPLPDTCNSKVQISSPDADANQLHDCAEFTLGETTRALSRWSPLIQRSALQMRVGRSLASPITWCTQFSQSRSSQHLVYCLAEPMACLLKYTLAVVLFGCQAQHLFPVAAAQSRYELLRADMNRKVLDNNSV